MTHLTAVLYNGMSARSGRAFFERVINGFLHMEATIALQV
jgi:hypothetical protein